MTDHAESLVFDDAGKWEAWLASHHDQRDHAWLKIAKKGSGRVSVTISEALDVALCYGWIDSQRRTFDEAYYLQRYSPRRPASAWSRVNVARVEALTAAGRMRPAGRAEVAAATSDGRWDAAYESQRTATVPDDLAAALAHSEPAGSRFAQLSRTDRYLVILRLLKARTPAQRAARVAQAVATLAAGGAVR